MIVVDSSVWVAAFRQRRSAEAQESARLLQTGRVLMLGIVMGELLQGIRNQQELAQVEETIRELPYAEVTQKTWRDAGNLSHRLRQEGNGVPFADALIATLTMDGNHELFTLDRHFERIPRLKLYKLTKRGRTS